MKLKYIFILLLCSAKIFSWQSPIDTMSAQHWVNDLDYLNKRIQEEFVSFDTTVKQRFNDGIQVLKNELQLESGPIDSNNISFRIMQLMAGLKDGHTELQVFGSDLKFKRLPLILYYFEEGLYLLGAHEEFKEHIGKKVRSIGGISTSQFLPRLQNLIAHDNEYELLHSLPSYLILPRAMKFMGLTNSIDRVQYEFESDDGKTELVNIRALTIDDYVNGNWIRYRTMHKVELPLSSSEDPRWYWYKYLEEDSTMYFYYGVVNNQKGQTTLRRAVRAMFKEMDEKKPKKFIIDLRRNRGGNYNYSRHLLQGIKERDWLNQKGKIYAISGRTTFSAAMVTSIWLKRDTNTILVGEPSRGHPNKTSNVEHFKLPNSRLRIEYTTRIKRHWAELGLADHVPLDVELPVKFADYKNGNDNVLQYIRNK